MLISSVFQKHPAKCYMTAIESICSYIRLAMFISIVEDTVIKLFDDL